MPKSGWIKSGWISSLALTGALSAAAQVPDSLNPYVRKPRTAAVSAEVGGNSLAGLVGLKGTLFVNPQFAVDVGLGISLTGLRPGAYARYNFTKGKLSPFAYGGFKVGLGIPSMEGTDIETGEEIEIRIKPSPFLDLGVGLDYLAHNGFYLMMGLGWSELLGGDNFEYPSGPVSQEEEDIDRVVFGSGLGAFLNLGYAF
jgi:hypothetical protein